MKDNDFLRELKKKIIGEDKNASVILFGSRARGDNKSDSDWDLLIITSKKRNVEFENRLRESIYEVELEHLQPVSTIILNKNEWQNMAITPFYHNVTTEGKIL